MKNLNKLDLEEAIFLLEQSEYFINGVPNRRYSVKIQGEDSYKLASKIHEFINKVKKDG